MQRHGGSPLIQTGTVARGRGADGAVSSLGTERRGLKVRSGNEGGGLPYIVQAADRGPRAPTLCLVCGVYTTRVQVVFPLAAPHMKSKALFGLWNAVFIPIAGGLDLVDL
ncbi:hypothetical protein GCM10010365_73450 [Streptomyces poonensis]|uniref:Uncharacterized protein n=1 Tax=Streptomyces poonensis TaxID=68255 RepID=A0A918QEG2_9ACTN|nr:hypothetical protein GCM10010365_73450 [Streptomyces poonensis]GLJ92711.1 hypothetical protein GCM10017589_53210 [Streptomyces poonensis]